MPEAAADATVALVPVAAPALLVADADATVAAIKAALQSILLLLFFRFYSDFLIQNSQRNSQRN